MTEWVITTLKCMSPNPLLHVRAFIADNLHDSL